MAAASISLLLYKRRRCGLCPVSQRGDTAKAKWQYEKILGKALLGRGPAEHWAHSEYAWIAFNDGDLQARAQTPQHCVFYLMNPDTELEVHPSCGDRASGSR